MSLSTDVYFAYPYFTTVWICSVIYMYICQLFVNIGICGFTSYLNVILWRTYFWLWSYDDISCCASLMMRLLIA